MRSQAFNMKRVQLCFNLSNLFFYYGNPEHEQNLWSALRERADVMSYI